MEETKSNAYYSCFTIVYHFIVNQLHYLIEIVWDFWSNKIELLLQYINEMNVDFYIY